jgi:hypothetical protein
MQMRPTTHRRPVVTIVDASSGMRHPNGTTRCMSECEVQRNGAADENFNSGVCASALLVHGAFALSSSK